MSWLLFAPVVLGIIQYPEPAKARAVFWSQLENSGYFPIEVNVPDTISNMAEGVNQMVVGVQDWWGGGSNPKKKPETVDDDLPNITNKLKNARSTNTPKIKVRPTTPEWRITESAQELKPFGTIEYLYEMEENEKTLRKRRKDKVRREKLRREKLKKNKWPFDLNQILYFFMGLFGMWPIPLY